MTELKKNELDYTLVSVGTRGKPNTLNDGDATPTIDGQQLFIVKGNCLLSRRTLQLFKLFNLGKGELPMEGRYTLYSQGSSGWTSMRNEEFQEGDVWGVLRETKYTINSKDGSSKEFSTSSITPRTVPTAAKMIPRANNNPMNHEPKSQIVQQSAPVNIPDWSKVYGKKHSKKNSNNYSWLDDDDDDDDEGNEFRTVNWDSDEEDDEGDANMIPPHEWITKKLARTQTSSFSVCEGAGRTLKGRDLKRVRNAILSKTGFLEQ